MFFLLTLLPRRLTRNTASSTYWAAVDKFRKAKQVDASCEAEANELINTYKKHFPNKEEAFMFGIQPGSQVTVGGWINEKTTAEF